MLLQISTTRMHHRVGIDGMTCTGCEAVLKREVENIDDVTDVTTDHKEKLIEFTTTTQATGSYVEEVIANLGYQVTHHKSA